MRTSTLNWDTAFVSFLPLPARSRLPSNRSPTKQHHRDFKPDQLLWGAPKNNQNFFFCFSFLFIYINIYIYTYIFDTSSCVLVRFLVCICRCKAPALCLLSQTDGCASVAVTLTCLLTALKPVFAFRGCCFGFFFLFCFALFLQNLNHPAFCTTDMLWFSVAGSIKWSPNGSKGPFVNLCRAKCASSLCDGSRPELESDTAQVDDSDPWCDGLTSPGRQPVAAAALTSWSVFACPQSQRLPAPPDDQRSHERGDWEPCLQDLRRRPGRRCWRATGFRLCSGSRQGNGKVCDDTWRG